MENNVLLKSKDLATIAVVLKDKNEVPTASNCEVYVNDQKLPFVQSLSFELDTGSGTALVSLRLLANFKCE